LKNKEILSLLAVEYKVKSLKTYKNPSQIQAQISKCYFGGSEGVIKLIKNNSLRRKIGNDAFKMVSESWSWDKRALTLLNSI